MVLAPCVLYFQNGFGIGTLVLVLVQCFGIGEIV